MASSISFPDYPTQQPLKSALRRSSMTLSTSPRLSIAASNDSRISLSSSVDSSKAPRAGSDRKIVKTKTKNKKKEFEAFYLSQTLLGPQYEQSAADPILTMKFSQDGCYLATASKGGVVRIWQLSPDTYVVDELFVTTPVREFTSHNGAVLDLSWSKNNFLLTSSMDKTARLWHVDRNDCLCIFQHYDIVTSVEFHPKDDRYFLSGSIDAKLRIWNIPAQCVHVWSKISDTQMITAAGFTQDGTKVCAGSAQGAVHIFKSETLELEGEVCLGTDRKVTGIEPSPTHPSLVLVSSNDSITRMVDCTQKQSLCSLKGSTNTRMQIAATFSDDGKYVISGSEDKRVYIWKTAEQIHALTGEDSLSEQEIRVPSEISEGSESMTKKELKVLQKQEKREAKARKKREKDQMKKVAKNEPEHFEAHKDTVISAILAPLKTRRRLSMDGTMLVSADETGCIRIWTCSSPNTDGDGSTSSSSDNLS
ncbi:unnamed protein product [Umbelopsis sp. WA50703]